MYCRRISLHTYHQGAEVESKVHGVVIASLMKEEDIGNDLRAESLSHPLSVRFLSIEYTGYILADTTSYLAGSSAESIQDASSHEASIGRGFGPPDVGCQANQGREDQNGSSPKRVGDRHPNIATISNHDDLFSKMKRLSPEEVTESKN